MKMLLGIDPGIHGGLAIVAIDDGAAPQLIDAIDIPVTGIAGKERVDGDCTTRMDHGALPAARLHRTGADDAEARRFLRVQIWPRRRRDRSGARLLNAMTIVEPAKWKKFQRALQLFPSAHALLAQEERSPDRLRQCLLRSRGAGGATVITLWPYQERGVKDIRALFQQGRRRVCYAAPTASGKTVVFCHLAHRIVQAGQRVAIIVHRQELVDQTCKALAAEGLAYGTIAAGYPENASAPVLACMAQTLAHRSGRLDGIHYVVVDEAHHVVAATWRAILEKVPHARVLGVTATPERLDGKGLREAFDALMIGPTVKTLIAGGWLSPFVVYAPERLVDLKGIRAVAGDYALGELATAHECRARS